jgi:hypothetical protein
MPLTEHYAMKAYWGVEVCLQSFLTSALYGGVWPASRLGRFTPRVRAPGTHWIGGLVGPRAGLDWSCKIFNVIRNMNCNSQLFEKKLYCWLTSRGEPIVSCVWISSLQNDIETRLRAGRPGFSSRQEKWWDFFPFADRPRSTPGLVPNVHRQ